MIKRIAKHFLARFGLELRKSDSPRYNKLGNVGVPYNEWEARGKKIFLKILNITVEKNSTLILAYAIAKRISNGGGHFFYDTDGRLQLSIQGVNFFINFTDELFVIAEVFINRDYNFKTTDQLLILDIGLNIGATALFFSTQKNVKTIYSYELFEPTYLAAKRNFEINDASKIISLNVGLGRETKQLQIPYSESSKARMGLHGLPSSEEFPDAKLVTVTIIDVAEEINRIHNLEPDIKKVCKMDCEGAEFEILARLFEKKVIRLIDVYIIEWHNEDPKTIESEFLQNGFDVLKPTSDDPTTGIIYAFKKGLTLSN